MLYTYRDTQPQIAAGVFIAPDAAVIGNVKIGAGSGVWFGCTVRGDVHHIEIGENTNIQDQSVLHVTGGKFPLIIGSGVTLGHRVTVHGCVIGDNAFLGIGSTVLDGCELGEYSFLAAGSLLPPGKKIPPRKLAMGAPAKILRDITDEEEEMMNRIRETYGRLRGEYLDENLFRAL